MDNNDLSFEPMDVDLSTQSLKDMDISFNDVTQPAMKISTSPCMDQKPCYKTILKDQVVKRYHINIRKQHKSSKIILVKIISTLITLLISILTYQMYSLKCYEHLDLKNFRTTFPKRLFGQQNALNLIIKTLEMNSNSKILFLYGGTGVGKTFTSSLLLETLDSRSNVYHYIMPSFRYIFSSDLMFGLTMCQKSLIIVDDLTVHDMDVKEQIQNVISKSESLGKEIIVLLIYNCNEDKDLDNRCDILFRKKLEDNFSEIKALKSFIPFEPLLEIHLKKCIMQELGARQLDPQDFNNIQKQFNVSLNGCKGVHSKMKYFTTV